MFYKNALPPGHIRQNWQKPTTKWSKYMQSSVDFDVEFWVWSFWYPSHWNSWVLQRGIGGILPVSSHKPQAMGLFYTFRSTSSGPSHFGRINKTKQTTETHTHTHTLQLQLKRISNTAPSPPEIHVKGFWLVYNYCPLDLGPGARGVPSWIGSGHWFGHH